MKNWYQHDGNIFIINLLFPPNIKTDDAPKLTALCILRGGQGAEFVIEVQVLPPLVDPHTSPSFGDAAILMY